ncbi:hypothetical protein PPL_08689 [Heterostelium album PN500]|uniref:Uncharacterized protein n=1 Tax=Heterostelium pallidum (strain ATCC 26659 / Pp 5 / PN500) TaxID=670386 RepID=D3BJG3_HETP5|nr:hypothetical protein PPL_08689 [Heterostelium album PN500]EFA78043.1 hypothetical protein PPL_08689 [Heterostelium album PN500]|eukprot:XP_020430170.1 hypothetical protein PPL_08689 [Heterostelium album PN500]
MNKSFFYLLIAIVIFGCIAVAMGETDRLCRCQYTYTQESCAKMGLTFYPADESNCCTRCK